MNVLSVTGIFYLFYSVYTLFVMSVSDYKLEHVIWGLLAIWLVYFFYYLGFKSIKKRKSESCLQAKRFSYINSVYNWGMGTYFFHVLLSWVSSIASVKYYTGLSPSQVVANILAGNSLYAFYQQYFKDMGIAVFSFSKVPFVLMRTYLTIILFASFLGICLAGKKLLLRHYTYLILIALAYYYIGISRGTNFEMYILLVLLVYCILCKKSNSKKSSFISLAVVGALGILAVLIFRVVLTERGVSFQNYICTEIQFIPQRFVAICFPVITNLGLSVFSYLGYGIYSIGVAISDIAFTSVDKFTALLVPSAYPILLGKSLSEILRDTIDVGVRWIPDWIVFTGYLGIPLFLTLIWFLGRFTARCFLVNIPDLLVDFIGCINFLFMLSIPVGNFIFASTPNVGLVLFVVIWYVGYRYFYVKLKWNR